MGHAPIGGHDDADGVRITCGEGETAGEGCGEGSSRNVVRFEGGRAVGVRPESEVLELAPEKAPPPRGPDPDPA